MILVDLIALVDSYKLRLRPPSIKPSLQGLKELQTFEAALLSCSAQSDMPLIRDYSENEGGEEADYVMPEDERRFDP